ncbi:MULTISPECIES: ribosome maturation factor RimM [Fusobacterium]|uniref:ribosome maturation factor RimM n=1 Tax=Fusobacterium TaxID=848 RepID=UPI0014770EE4|nr:MULTISPECIES: ribosome maturation factor RimM [Fusobacterium]NME36592.1 16S rRNA processing protein RimM [Fusobacterium sp. FSA-380-WT-3A]
MEELVIIGKITGTHHLKGALKANINIGEEEDLIGEKVLVEKPNGEKNIFTVKKISPLVGDKFILEFEEIENKTQGNLLQNSIIKVNRMVLGLEEDEYLLQDLLGMEVITLEDKNIGKVTEVFDTAAHEILVVETDETEALIPNIDTFIKEIDFENKKIIVELWEGMLEEKQTK